MAGVRGVAALGRLVAFGASDPESDAALLARFAATGDEAAFAALVRRHGPVVAAVCRRHLRQPADVDDAVQATFLVLARRAGAVHTAVGPFLYRVAERTAWRLRRSVRAADPLPDVPARPGGLPPDVRAVVNEELGRLPERYRLAVELCYVAGYTTAEAAARLGWPKGTVLTRLAWARKRLRANLSRRGVTLGGSLAAVLADRAAAGGVRVTAGGESGRVLSLCEGVVRAMTLTKLGWAAGLTAVAAAGLGFGSWATGQAPPASKLPSLPAIPAVPPADPQPLVPDPPPLQLPTIAPVVSAEPSRPSPPALAIPTVPPAVPVAERAGKSFTVSHPAGGFVREFAGGERISLWFGDDRLTAEVTPGKPDAVECFYLEADYAMNKEGVVFGVVTAVEAGGADDGEAQLYVGTPFAVRLRVDGGTLSVTDFRFGPVELKHEWPPTLRAALGRYTAAAGAAPARKPVKPRFGKPLGPTVKPSDTVPNLPPPPK